MEEIAAYGSIIAIGCLALITTAIAGFFTASKPHLIQTDDHDIPLWLTPLGYLLIALVFIGIDKLNRPIIALAALGVYGLSIAVLFMPSNVIPKGFQWHYIIGAAVIGMIFLG